MFEENKNPATNEVAENVEELTTEELVDGAKVESEGQEPVQNTEQPKTYTKEEVDDIKRRYKDRVETKLRKEYEKKYGRLEDVLKAGRT